MSSTETRVGKIKPLPGTAEEAAKEVLLKENIIGPDYPITPNMIEPFCSSFYEVLMEKDFYDKYIEIDDTLYEITETYKSKDEAGLLYMSEAKSDGTRDYVLQYYNGGCSFSEALESAIEYSE